MADEIAGGVSRIIGGEAGRATAEKLSEYTAQAFKERDWLLRFGKVGAGRLQGRAFEFASVLDFNRAAQQAGEPLIARCLEGTGAVDIEVVNTSTRRVVQRIQAKSYRDSGSMLRAFRNDRYGDQVLLGTQDRVKDAREAIASGRAQPIVDMDRVKDRIGHDGVTGRGITRAEADRIAASLETETAKAVLRQSAQEVGRAATAGALSAGALQLVVRSGLEALQFDAETSTGEAVTRVLTATARASAEGGVVAGGGQALGIIARRAGAPAIANSAAPTAIANSIFEAGRASYRFATGETSTADWREEMGTAVLRGTATFYCGLAGQVLIPVPVLGAAVGSTVGYLTSAIMVESGILGMGPANVVGIAADRRIEVERSCLAACELVASYEELARRAASHEELLRETQIAPAIDLFQNAVDRGEALSQLDALEAISTALGNALPFRDLAEFDRFMLDPSSRLQI